MCAFLEDKLNSLGPLSVVIIVVVIALANYYWVLPRDKYHSKHVTHLIFIITLKSLSPFDR